MWRPGSDRNHRGKWEFNSSLDLSKASYFCFLANKSSTDCCSTCFVYQQNGKVSTWCPWWVEVEHHMDVLRDNSRLAAGQRFFIGLIYIYIYIFIWDTWPCAKKSISRCVCLAIFHLFVHSFWRRCLASFSHLSIPGPQMTWGTPVTGNGYGYETKIIGTQLFFWCQPRWFVILFGPIS